MRKQCVLHTAIDLVLKISGAGAIAHDTDTAKSLSINLDGDNVRDDRGADTAKTAGELRIAVLQDGATNVIPDVQ